MSLRFSLRLPSSILSRSTPSLQSPSSLRFPLLSPIRCSSSAKLDQIKKIHNAEAAGGLVEKLSRDEKQLLQAALLESLKLHENEKNPNGKALNPIEAKALFLFNTLPFIAFGFLDNAIMIVAGEYIELGLAAWVTVSTMAAAAIGNIVSDVAGVGLGHYVEIAVVHMGIRHPVLTAKQLESTQARLLSNGGRAFGLTIGCIIGMFPLLFFNEEEKHEMKKELKKDKAAAEQSNEE